MELDNLSSLDSAAACPPNRFHVHHRLQLPRTRVAVIFLLAMGAMGAMWSAPAAGAQNPGGPNFANSCSGGGPSLYFNQSDAHWDSTGTRLALTDGGLNEIGNAYCTYVTTISPNGTSFATTFTFQLTDPLADGFTFIIISQPGLGGANAGGRLYPFGGGGGGLGYSGLYDSETEYGPLPNVAIKFDLYNNVGEGPNSTGLYIDGATPDQPSIDLTGTGIDLHSGDPIDATVAYVQPTLNLTLTDTVTQATWSHAFTVDLPAVFGSQPGVGFGFTAATGGLGATQEILAWNIAQFYYPAGFSPDDFSCFQNSNPPSDARYPLLLPNLTSPQQLAITLAQGNGNSASSVFCQFLLKPFTTDFTFQISNASGGTYIPPLQGGQADGLAFVIQRASATSVQLGGIGGGLGYLGIPNSIAIKFDLFDNEGEGPNSTGLYTDGAFPGQPSINLTGTGIDLHSPDILDAHITYDGTTLTLTLTDTVTKATWSHAFPIDIAATIGGTGAYVGFTGATGAETATIQILSWTLWYQ